LQPIAQLLARKATQRTARSRAITDRRELCRSSLDTGVGLKARLDIRNLPGEGCGRYNTRAARLREETGHLMEVGDRIRCMGWVFEVLALECKRIDNVLPPPEDGTPVASSKHQYPGCSARRKPCINGCWGLMPRIFNEILKVVAQKRHIILIIRGSSPLSKIQTP
jgi:hypothetical protein